MQHDVYKDAGVDTEAADEGLRRLTDNVRATWPHPGAFGEVKLDIGYFANVVAMGDIGLALCTDGVGSKAIIAQMVDKYDTVGIDCVAMNVNDLICVGARPVSMVDYIAIERANPDLLEALSRGLCEGARLAGVSISGGEISQIKDIITGNRPGFGFDLVGMAIGDVSLDKINFGQSVEPGDIVIGIEGNGIHSNGLSLARRAFFELNNFSIDHQFDELELPLGMELLRPTLIYVAEVLEMLATHNVKALAHITSDGLLNLTRVKAPVGYVIDNMPPLPSIFSLVQRYAEVSSAEMYQIYNMGVGFCVVVSPDDADNVLSIIERHGKQAWKIGYAVADPERHVTLPKQNLKGHGGRGKRFHSV
ncbi:MAG: phosphoribosylformylglycinamidine cyclo-ligase [Alphaproteobacteria bacterium]|nr:MAG: phosphoribosylformylglycinamidine cyclo-ligase [Alphaproteobacteria bacterium]